MNHGERLQNLADGLERRSIVIMRGIPGSGKSTIVNRIVEIAEGNMLHSNICSADDYFFDERGCY